jgi:hypothetical protein
MPNIKRVLLNLDSVKASFLFVAVLTIASLSIVFDIGVPAIPIAGVVVYGCILLAASYWFFVPHSDMTKNSPYFLSFLLFLVALYSIFREARGDLVPATILPRLAAALVPTVFGLSFRQFLFALDPAQRDHDAFYRTLEEELKRNAVEFKKAQIQLVELVENFTQGRQAMLAIEEKTAQDYVDHMRRAVALFDESSSAYPKAILDAVTALNKRVTAVIQKLEQVIDKVEQVDIGTVSRASEALRSLAAELAGANTQLNALKNGAELTTRDLSKVASGIEQLANTTSTAIERSRDILVSGISDTLIRLRGLIENEHLSISATAKPIRDDLQAIDRILTDFVKILELKVLTAAGLTSENETA